MGQLYTHDKECGSDLGLPNNCMLGPVVTALVVLSGFLKQLWTDL